jgi:hypothetical protein
MKGCLWRRTARLEARDTAFLRLEERLQREGVARASGFEGAGAVEGVGVGIKTRRALNRTRGVAVPRRTAFPGTRKKRRLLYGVVYE